MISAARIAKLNKFYRLRAQMIDFYCDAAQGSGVYRILNVKTGDCYIGAAKNLRARMSGHVHLFIFEMHTKLLQKAARRYGLKAFRFQVILFCEADQLTEYEQALIKRCKPAYNCRK